MPQEPHRLQRGRDGERDMLGNQKKRVWMAAG